MSSFNNSCLGTRLTKSYSDPRVNWLLRNCGNTYDTVASLLHEAPKQKGEEEHAKHPFMPDHVAGNRCISDTVGKSAATAV